MIMHGLSKHPLYNKWSAMIFRCYNPKSHNYKYYGARGITVCDEGKNSVKSFIEWGMENGWESGLIFDRIENNDNDRPDNCRFVTMSISNKNKRRSFHPSKKSKLPTGVFNSRRGLYSAVIGLNTSHINLGTFQTIKDAKNTYESIKKLIESKDFTNIIYLTLLAFNKNPNLCKRKHNKRRIFQTRRENGLPRGLSFVVFEKSFFYYVFFCINLDFY